MMVVTTYNKESVSWSCSATKLQARSAYSYSGEGCNIAGVARLECENIVKRDCQS